MRVTFSGVKELKIVQGLVYRVKRKMGNNYSNYYGLIFNCPIGVETEDCCFHAIRKFSIHDKLKYYNSMTEQERMKLIYRHQECLAVREKKTLFHESQ